MTVEEVGFVVAVPKIVDSIDYNCDYNYGAQFQSVIGCGWVAFLLLSVIDY